MFILSYGDEELEIWNSREDRFSIMKQKVKIIYLKLCRLKRSVQSLELKYYEVTKFHILM